MDWGTLVFGAFLGVAGLFALTAFALYPVMRSGFLVWIGLRIAAFTLMAIALFDVPLPRGFPIGAQRIDLGETAVAMAIAVTGPLLASYLEPELKLGRLKLWLYLLLVPGALAGAATLLAPRWPVLDLVHDVLLMGMILAVITGLVVAIRAGSRAAKFQAGAWAPLIIVGLIALAYELANRHDMPLWTEAVLFALVVDFLVTASGIVDGFMIISRERDRAVADIAAARIAVATDPLTGIANRRGLALRFRSATHPRPRGLAVLDCDHFKQINDIYGHDIGDEVLVAVAQALSVEGVFAARLGGEEFVLLLYDENWQQRAEEIRQSLTLAVFEAVPEVVQPSTSSAGLTAILAHDTLDSATKRADRALYAAKNAGRDRSLILPECGTLGPRLVATT